MQTGVAAIMHDALCLNSSLKGHAAEWVAEADVIGRRLKRAADGIVVGNVERGRLMTFDQKQRETRGRRQRLLCVSPAVGLLVIPNLGFVAYGRDRFIHCPKGHYMFTSEVMLEG